AQAEHLVVSAPLAGTVELGDAGGGLPALPDAAAAAPADLSALAGQAGGLGQREGNGTLRVGAPVAAGQTLFTVYDLSSLYVTADVDEVDAPQVRAGQRATVLVDAFPDVEFEGVVESVQVSAATTQAGGVGYPTRIRVLGAAGEAAPDVSALRLGMTASAEIATKTVASDTVVPSRALLRRDGGTVVYALRDGAVAAVAVSVQALGEDDAAVTGVLGDGEQVVVSGYEDLTDGDRVRLR
ncbi:MAG TPA: efflux RND transporter periplasmic adaptor subunit, partial [Egibacteraceae bacterium]|nr:efflux RND transporter periplasmic adaptor subunit [Egibacteraceae bacterium]